MYKAEPCKCGHKVCKDWHISSIAAVQGVKFTEEQATGIAAILNMSEFASPKEAASKLAAMHEDYGHVYIECKRCGNFTHEMYVCRSCGKDHTV